MILTFAQLAVAGLAIGGVYALLAIGYSILYRSTRTINFAQGDLGMLGAYIALWIGSVQHLGPVLGALGAIIGVAVLSMIVEVLAFRPIYKFGAVFVIVSSIGLVFVLETVMQLWWGARAISVPPSVPGTLKVAGLVVTLHQVMILAVVAALAVLLQVFFRTPLGRALRASSENTDVAYLLGINTKAMATLSYGLAGAFTAVAGVLLAPITFLTPSGGASIGLVGLIAAILGGLGNVLGAVVGGILIGFVAVFGSYWAGGSNAELITFGVLIALLLLRPQGLFSEEGILSRQ